MRRRIPCNARLDADARCHSDTGRDLQSYPNGDGNADAGCDGHTHTGRYGNAHACCDGNSRDVYLGIESADLRRGNAAEFDRYAQ
jgi:hypothetical protein